MTRTSSIIGTILLALAVAIPAAHANREKAQAQRTTARGAPIRANAVARPGGVAGFRGAVSVFGTANPSPEQAKLAQYVGFLLARRGYIVLNGGKGGVMKEVSRGAKQGGGFVIGIMPGNERGGANRYVDLEIPTGLNELRNTVLANAGNSGIAIGTTPGTTSEIAWALREGKKVVAPKGGAQPIEAVTFVSAPREGTPMIRLMKQAQRMVDEATSSKPKR